MGGPDVFVFLAVGPGEVEAVFPAGGLGTRFLPATKVIPKEMLALVDKPIIQYGVEEAIASGIEHIIIVTGRGKGTMEDHFDHSFELDATLERRGKHELLAVSRGVSALAKKKFSGLRLICWPAWLMPLVWPAVRVTLPVPPLLPNPGSIVGPAPPL